MRETGIEISDLKLLCRKHLDRRKRWRLKFWMSKPENLRWVRVVEFSLLVSRRHLASYSHRKSPHKFTQPQLMTCLILRALTKTTYRGLIEFLEVSPVLQEAMGLKSLPHFSTLQC